MALADWVWLGAGDSEEIGGVSPTLCVSEIPFMPTACWTQLVAKALGILIILGACINKIPMILNMLQAKSSVGLSTTACYGEILMLTNSAAYGMLEGHPFTAYGETITLWIQSAVVVVLLWKYAPKESSSSEPWQASIAFLVYTVSIFLFLPSAWNDYLISSQWPVMLYSRGNQILESMRVKHTGAQSLITMGLNTLGALARIFTTYKEVGWNMVLLLGFSLGFLTNFIMLLQIIVYRKNTMEFFKAMEEKKQD